MHIDFVDQTLRDGQQSLWGLRMRAFEAAGALPHLASTGFSTIDLTGPGMFTVLTRDYFDDPWDTTDFLVAGLPGNTLRAGMRTNSVMGFSHAPEAIIDLWVKTLIKHGVTSFWLYDVAYDMPTMKRLVDVVTAEGGEAVPTVMYGLTSVHGDEFFADRAREMASWKGVKTVEVEDAPGVLTPERARTLLPAIRQAVGDTRLELHCHTSTGLGVHNYVIGLESGFNAVHTASRPMANGVSLPSTEAMVNIVEYLGHTHSLDTSKFAPVDEHFVRAAAEGGHLLGIPAEFDPRIYDHQLPGGMTGTLLRQLGQHGMTDRFPEVLRAIPQVRIDFGEPIMATPMSQFVGIQAVLNIITGDPYSLCPDEVIHYLLGHYGPIYGPVNQQVKDRILSSNRAKEIAKWERPNPTLKEIRARFEAGISDEELLLRFMNSKEEVDKTLANGPVRKDPRRSSNQIVANIVDLVAEKSRATSLSLQTPAYSVSLQKSGRSS
ncbi:carboxyltransferase [Cryobacterium sp. TMS1-20-1]|uniref:carboxyltransferase n=1 Tax=Cryobacterium sp. TMS1-20-1 TaxID=1259223 RepID=UPI00106B57FA|nr:carboxyltransferase [Cryobacterium sp. TMS1-20-1]TFC70965.1 carboxyltransferase [Cryobacterium sp. TMS1-20-1]